MRESGILMPVSSLPGPFGIGTLGKSAYDFVDFLARAGPARVADIAAVAHRVWQQPVSKLFGLCGQPLFYRF